MTISKAGWPAGVTMHTAWTNTVMACQPTIPLAKCLLNGLSQPYLLATLPVHRTFPLNIYPDIKLQYPYLITEYFNQIFQLNISIEYFG